MKKIIQYILACMFLFGYNISNAQIESVLELELPTGLYNVNDTLYIGTFNDNFVRYVIDSGEEPEVLFDFSNFRIERHQDDLYIPDTNENIYRFDLSNDSLSLFFDQGEGIRGVAVFNDTLYYAEFSSGEIRKINLLDNNPSSELVLGGLDTLNAMQQYDGDIYFIEDIEEIKILKIDLTQNDSEIDTLFFGEVDAPTELYALGDYMYVSEFVGNKVSRFRLDEESPNIELVIDNILLPTGLTSDDNFLYISSFEGNEILRVPLSNISSIVQEPDSKRPHVYPNPSTGQMIVSNIGTEERFRIYSVMGQLIQTGSISDGQNLMLNNSNEGSYLLQIGDRALTKIIIK